MARKGSRQVLKNLSPAQVRANPENPRLVFRQEEMESLMLSIDKHGIQVPITVFQDGDHFTLLDGERRWRCAQKLNLKSIPAIVQDRPSELENLVLMYNIHALREQWDYFTIASKLERVMALYENENAQAPNEIILSELTGLTRGAIRRCQLLIDLPERFKVMLLDELDKPKLQQRLSEDFFIEMERSLKTVVNRLPEYAPLLEEMRDVLIEKFKKGKIAAVTDFRQLSKIATAVDGLGIAQSQAKRALDKVFDSTKGTSIREAYVEAVQFEYVEKRVGRSVQSLMSFIEDVENENQRSELDDDLMKSFKQLHKVLGRILGR
ncbi:ParB/RepB/Spo0J family partition protein [Roseovarius pelagicus]|uniref:ParB/RepB/Spo0J family partition protein n=1 Tax=Roseovarius pelagicus TaxID=2980108 RepID=A0ABY6D9N1_9RHOB|nr:ParB/RepB/Spo0J family partition protein [Roseovarius pelagicus]UXX81778.1 ParB/RepB/Spo0J family partition protein [Roseovarius pelagicus]